MIGGVQGSESTPGSLQNSRQGVGSEEQKNYQGRWERSCEKCVCEVDRLVLRLMASFAILLKVAVCLRYFRSRVCGGDHDK